MSAPCCLLLGAALSDGGGVLSNGNADMGPRVVGQLCGDFLENAGVRATGCSGVRMRKAHQAHNLTGFMLLRQQGVDSAVDTVRSEAFDDAVCQSGARVQNPGRKHSSAQLVGSSVNVSW